MASTNTMVTGARNFDIVLFFFFNFLPGHCHLFEGWGWEGNEIVAIKNLVTEGSLI